MKKTASERKGKRGKPKIKPAPIDKMTAEAKAAKFKKLTEDAKEAIKDRRAAKFAKRRKESKHALELLKQGTLAGWVVKKWDELRSTPHKKEQKA